MANAVGAAHATPLDHARALTERGFSVVPVPFRSKKSVLTGWPDLRLTLDKLPDYFSDAPSNIGVLTGEPSGWIVDVDLDHPLALKRADGYLPLTGMEWGRQSKPRSHRLYRVTAPVDNAKWKISGGGPIELRATGLQTVAPGSVHPSGEEVRWDADGEPASIGPDELVEALESLAKAVRAELGETLPDLRPASPPPETRSNGVTVNGRGYAATALRREAEAVASEPHGSRNDRLNTAAFNVGTLVGGGGIDRAAAEAALLKAGVSVGLPEDEVRRTVRSGLDAGEQHPRCVPAQTQERQAEDQSPPPAFLPTTAAELIDDYPELREELIGGLLRRGETMNLVAPPKVGKSWLIHSLLMAAVRGESWLGKSVRRVRVLLIDAELHSETLAKRLRWVRDVFKATRNELLQITIWPVRGLRMPINDVLARVAEVPAGTFDIIVLDALYRFLPVDGEENSNETMTQVYNTLDAIAKVSGAAVIAVHHTSKGDQGLKNVTDVGSGAGAQSRAPDTHLVLRWHEEPDAMVAEAVTRSFPPMQPFVIVWENPVWRLEPLLDPKLLRKPGAGASKKKDEKPKAAPKREWTPGEFAERIVGDGIDIKEEIFDRAKRAGISGVMAESLFKRCLAEGSIHRHQAVPNAPHRFSTRRPELFTPTEAGRGEVAAPRPPEHSARGGTGGALTPPPPPKGRRGKKTITTPAAAQPAGRCGPPSRCRTCQRSDFVIPEGGHPEDWQCVHCHPPVASEAGGQERSQGVQQ